MLLRGRCFSCHLAKADPRVQTWVAVSWELPQCYQRLVASCELCRALQCSVPLKPPCSSPPCQPTSAHGRPWLQCTERCRWPHFRVFHPFSGAAQALAVGNPRGEAREGHVPSWRPQGYIYLPRGQVPMLRVWPSSFHLSRGLVAWPPVTSAGRT